MTETITVQAIINAPVQKVWKKYTTPEDIIRWNNATEDWHTPIAHNDVKKGGKFLFRMEAKDGSIGFDFTGTYDEVKINELIAYTINDGRKVKTTFKENNEQTKITITFDAENENPAEIQKNGWQSILNNFKKYAENIKN